MDAEDLVAFLRSHQMPVPPELENEVPEAKDAIVVVEDDKSYGKLLLRAIESSDIKADVTLAVTGMDGLIEIGRANPAVVVLDYSLPDLNAAEVVERLLAPGRQLDAEVLIVTGGVQDADVMRLQALGVKEIVQKADGIDAVLAAIGKALARQRAD